MKTDHMTPRYKLKYSIGLKIYIAKSLINLL